MPASPRSRSTIQISRDEADTEAAEGASPDGEPTEPTEPTEPQTGDALPQVDLTRCAKRNESKTRQCILNAGHTHYASAAEKGNAYTGTLAENGHLFRSGGKRKEYAALTAMVPEGADEEAAKTAPMFSFDDVPDDEEVTGVRETERSAEQKEIDVRVLAAHEAWTAAGKPSEFNSPSVTVKDGDGNDVKVTPRKRIMFAPGNAETVAAMMDKAARFHGVNVRLVGPRHHESGNHFYFYVVKDKTAKRSGAQANANADDGDSGE
jgi:hypothetical protein